jgi:hypothetical protein
MAGNTNMLIGRWHGHFVHVPMPLATRFRKQVNTNGDLWAAVVESTGQPYTFDMPVAPVQLGDPASRVRSLEPAQRVVGK